MKIGLALGVIAISVSSGFSQSLPKDSLTWRDCVALALRNNPDLASSRYALEASQSAYSRTRNGLAPKLALDHGYRVPATTSNGSNWQTRASINVNLWEKTDRADIATSKTLVSQAEAGQREASTQVRYDLRKAFTQLLFVRKNIDVSQRIVAMRQDEAQLVTLRYNSGRESKGSMLRAKAQLLQAQADLSQSFRDMRIAQQALNRQLGLDTPSDFQAKDSLEPSPPGEPPKDGQTLIENRPDVLVERSVMRTAEANLDIARSDYWPTLSAGYTQFLDGYTELQNSWNVVLSYPLFGQGPTNTRYAILAAKSNLEKAKQDLRAVREQALVDLETAWSGYASSFDQSKVQAALLEAARQRNDEANIRYNSGLMTYDNWEIIASERISLEREAIQAQANVLVAEAAWQKSLGLPLAE